jgi:hypothetical protein
VGSVVQSHPANDLDSNTPYLAFLSQRETFFTGGGLLATHNQPVDKRRKALQEIFLKPNTPEFASALRENGIKYVYLRKDDDEKFVLHADPPQLTKVFENDSVVIYRVFEE